MSDIRSRGKELQQEKGIMSDIKSRGKELHKEQRVRSDSIIRE